MFFVPFVLLSNALIPFQKIDFKIFQILSYVIVSIMVFGGLIWTIYKFISTKAYKNNYKKGLIIPLIISFSLLLFVVFNLLINLNFGSDIVYSVNISNNFKNSILLAENVDFGVIPSAYTTAAYIYIFPSLFPEDIIKCYSLLMPMIHIIFMFSIGYYISFNYIKKYKILYSCLISLIILTGYFIFAEQFQLPWISLIGVLLILLIECKKINPLRIYMCVIGFSFFSSSSYLLFLPIIAGMLINLLIFKKWKECIIFFPILFYLIAYNVYISYFVNQIFYLMLLLVFFISTICIFSWYFISLRKNKSFDWEYNNYDSKILNAKNNKFIIPVLFGALFSSILAFCLIEKQNIVVFSIIVFLILSILMIYLYFNATMSNNIYQRNIICMLFTILFIAMLEYVIFKFISGFTEYHLVSRLIFLFNGLSNDWYLITSQSIYVIFLSTFIVKLTDSHGWFNITNIKFKNFDLSEKFIVINTKIKNTKFTKYYLTGVSVFSLLYIPIISMIEIKPTNMFSYQLSRTLNYDFLNNDEIKFLNSINFNDYNKTYIADFTAGPYLSKAIDLTTFMNYNIDNHFYLRTQVWQFKGFYYGLESWDIHYPKYPSIVGNNINENVAKLVLRTADQINSSKISFYNIKTKQQYNSLDFIFLSKNEQYPNYYSSVSKILENSYKTIMNSENLFCLQKII